MRTVYPDSVTVGPPIGEIVSAEELSIHLGGIAVNAVPKSLAGAAADFVENVLEHSFRLREITVAVTDNEREPLVILPWGLASAVKVTSDGDPVDIDTCGLKRYARYRYTLMVPNVDSFEATYRVGGESGFTDLIKQAVLRVAATMFHNRLADGSVARDDVLMLLAEYNLTSDWA